MKKIQLQEGKPLHTFYYKRKVERGKAYTWTEKTLCTKDMVVVEIMENETGCQLMIKVGNTKSGNVYLARIDEEVQLTTGEVLNVESVKKILYHNYKGTQVVLPKERLCTAYIELIPDTFQLPLCLVQKSYEEGYQVCFKNEENKKRTYMYIRKSGEVVRKSLMFDHFMVEMEIVEISYKNTMLCHPKFYQPIRLCDGFAAIILPNVRVSVKKVIIQ